MGCFSKKLKINSLKTAEFVANNIDLTGKVAIVTGASDGLGKETCRILLKQGAFVIMAVRDREKGDDARCEIVSNLISKSSQTRNILDKRVIILSLDLSSFQSIKNFVINFNKLGLPLHYLINDAGIMALPNYELTKDGIEKQFQINYLGHYYLTRLLIDNLIKTPYSRIINVSSIAHNAAPEPFSDWINKHYQLKQGPQKEEYSPQGFKDYGITKACQIIFTYELNNRYKDKLVKSVSLHPGSIDTKIWNYNKWFKGFHYICLKFLKLLPFDFKTVEQGAATIITCVVTKYDELKEDEFYKDCVNAQNSVRKDLLPSNDDKKETQLWELSELLIRQLGFDFEDINNQTNELKL